MSEEFLAPQEEVEEVLIEQPENIRGVKLDPNSYTAHRLVCLPLSFLLRWGVCGFGNENNCNLCVSVFAASCYP